MDSAFPRLDSLFQDVVYLVVVGRIEHKGDWLLVERLDLYLLFHGFRRRSSHPILRLRCAVIRMLLVAS